MAKDVVKKEATDIAVTDLEQDAGVGFEQHTSDDFAIPFLRMLQAKSPQCENDKPEYIDGARAGMMLEMATDTLYKEAIVIPVKYERSFIEWIPRKQGGGFVGLRDPAEVEEKYERNERGKWITEEGNEISDTRTFYCLLLNDNGSEMPVIVALTSTQIKKARKWNTIASNIKLQGKKGMFNPPLFSHMYKLSPVTESNAEGDWKGYKIELNGPVNKEQYEFAKRLRELIAKGQAKVDFSKSGEGESEEAEPATGTVDSKFG